MTCSCDACPRKWSALIARDESKRRRPRIAPPADTPPQRLRLVESVGKGQSVAPAGVHSANPSLSSQFGARSVSGVLPGAIWGCCSMPSQIDKSNLTYLLDELAKIARSHGRNEKQAFVDMALRVVTDAASGAIGPWDDEVIYDRIRVELGRGDKLQKEKSKQVQVSKLRKIIELGRVMGASARPLLTRTREILNDMANGPDFDNRKYKSTYSALVHVARKQLDQPRLLLGDKEIRRLLSA
jgi:hypothetical protein